MLALSIVKDLRTKSNAIKDLILPTTNLRTFKAFMDPACCFA